MLVYLGSKEIVKYPGIKESIEEKDFCFGFYCTKSYEYAKYQAIKDGKEGYLNKYEYISNDKLRILNFDAMTEEWLTFVMACRKGKVHRYDIVEGPMVDDTIYKYIQAFSANKISKEKLWSLLEEYKPIYQMSFHSVSGLITLKYLESEKIYE